MSKESAIDLSGERGETRAIDRGTVLEEYLEAKYERDEDEEDRWSRVEGVYHSGQLSNCARAWYWDWEQGDPQADPSAFPYFELGNAHEDRYGEALAALYGEERVRQDVEVEIYVDQPGEPDTIKIVGESDWCILRRDLNPDYGLWYVVNPDGTRTEHVHERTDLDNPSLEDLEVVQSNDVTEVEPLVETVIETKTTGDVSKKQKYGHLPQHERQLITYLHGIGVTDGKIVYIERDNLTEHVIDLPYDESTWLDNKFRAIRHHRNLDEDIPPAIDPIDRTQCWYCDHKERCNSYDGGSEWS